MENTGGRKLRGQAQPPRQFIYEEFQPSFDWSDDSSAYVILVDLPDFKKEDLKLQVDNLGKITISGERWLSENKCSRFKQTFDIPKDSIAEKVSGKFEYGLLFVIIPKKKVERKEAQKEFPSDNTEEGMPATKEEEKKEREKPTTKEEETKKEEGKPTARKEAKKEEKPTSKEAKKEEQKRTTKEEVTTKEAKKEEEKATTKEAKKEEDKDQEAKKEEKPKAKKEEEKKELEKPTMAKEEKPMTKEEGKDEKPKIKDGTKKIEEEKPAAKHDEAKKEEVHGNNYGCNDGVINKEREQKKDEGKKGIKEERGGMDNGKETCIVERGKVVEEMVTEFFDNLMEKIDRNKALIATAVVAFSIGLLITRKLRRN